MNIGETLIQESSNPPLLISVVIGLVVILVCWNRLTTSIAIFFLLATSVIGCTKFSDGDCIQHVTDGFIWRITKVHFRTYTVQGWFNGKWGLAVDESAGTFDSFSRYVKISCPFSTQTLHERQ